MTAVVPTWKQLLGVKLLVTEGGPQLSVAVGMTQVVRTQVSVLISVIFVGQVVKRGFVVSKVQPLVTVTVNEQKETLPLASVAV
jgi:hypothetical protein